jgi:hypothetical protein
LPTVVSSAKSSRVTFFDATFESRALFPEGVDEDDDASLLVGGDEVLELADEDEREFLFPIFFLSSL